MKIKDLIKLLLSLAIIAAILLYLYYYGYFNNVGKIRVSDWLILVGLTTMSYMVSGFQIYYLIRHVSKVRISASDVFFMPMSIGLFGYFIPTNGGFLYMLFFLKKKYKVETTRSFSVGIVTLYLSFILSGIALLACSFIVHFIKFYLIIIAVLLIVSPVLIYLMNAMLQIVPAKEGGLIFRLKVYFNSVVTDSHKMMMNKKATVMNALFTMIALSLFFIIYFMINRALGLDLSLLSIIALIAMQRVSSLIRLLPGNLGLEELFTAGIFGVIGQDPGLGLVFSIFFRLCTFMVMIPTGVTHTAFNIQYFSLRDVRKILKRKDPA